MSSWLGSFTFAKFAYVLIISLLIVVLFKELFGVLWNNTLYVGNFDYFTEGKPSSEQSKSFPAYVQGQHQLLRAALIEENHRRESAEAVPGVRYHRSLPSDLPEAARWTSILVDADLKVQGFDIGKILSTLRAWVSPPAQINGFVEKSGEFVRAAVNYPSRTLADGRHTSSSPFETGVLNGDASTALAIAASIVWTQAAEADKGFARIPREVFVSWILVWWDYRLLRNRTDKNQGWTADDKKRWKQARTLVDNLAIKGVYAETWRLRADLIETIPENLKNDTDLRTTDQIKGDGKLVIEDRKRYAEADSVATAISALNQITQATSKTVTALQDRDITAVSAAVKSALADTTTVYPGRTIWVRSASQNSTTDRFSATATAIVVDDGVAKLMLPDYVIGVVADGVEFEFRLSPSEAAIARATKADIVLTEGQSGGVLLARLVQGTPARNTVISGAGSMTISQVVSPPRVGAKLQLFTSRGSASTTVKGLSDSFVLVERITGPGDGGGPVLDDNRALVAMAYSGSGTESQFLSLHWLFARKPNLKLL